VSATVPAVPSKWCIAVTAKPEEGRAWASIVSEAVYTVGNYPGSLQLFAAGISTFNLRAVIYPSTSGAVIADYTAAMAAGSHRAISCGDATPTNLTLRVDGALATTTPSSPVGTGIVGKTTLRLGAGDVGTTWAGFIKDWRLYKISKSNTEAK
jgi:hypothetical protein